MAILTAPATASSGVDIEAWTVEQAAEALSATTISPAPIRVVRGTSVAIEIPLDERTVPASPEAQRDRDPRGAHTVYRRREPIRRDSQKRREALLKGKEGSRRRQRWENDRLLNNPYAQPPLPSDWEVRPTYPVQSVPYFLAPLWDAEYKARAQRKSAPQKKPVDRRAHGTKEDQAASRVPAVLREKLKRSSRNARFLLQDLESEVRAFMEQWEAREKEMQRDGLILEPDSEDEEIVFVGLNGEMSDERRKQRDEKQLRRDKMVFESFADDRSAAFGRWLVHSIATYYGLETWSVTTGNPARREAYVGLKEDDGAVKSSVEKIELPRPLWGLV